MHAEQGTSAIVIGGTTGESASLEAAELAHLVKAAREVVDLPLVAGAGAASTGPAIARAKHAASLGVDALLVLTPFYLRTSQEGMYRHFAAIAEDIDLPVIAYNVPGRTGNDLAVETTLRLAQDGIIRGLKEAVPEMGRFRELASLGDDFSLLSGDDGSFAAAMAAGADGVISVAANVVPGAIAEICALAARGDHELAGRKAESLDALFAFLAIEPNPIPVKHLAQRLFGGESSLRLPLIPLAKDFRDAAEEILAQYRPYFPELSF